MNKFLVIIGVAVLLLSIASASITMIDGAECIKMYPGDSVTKTLRIEADEDGWYTVKIMSVGITAEPTEMDIYLEEDTPEYFPVVLRAPVNVFDEKYMLVVDLYTEGGQYVEGEMFCVHVVRDHEEVSGETSTFVFGAGQYYEEGGYIVVPLYVESDDEITVEFDSDFKEVVFEKTAVKVGYGEKVEIKARIPSDVSIPEKITFYAFAGDERKEVSIRFPKSTLEKKTEIEAPEHVEVSKGVLRVPVKIRNVGDVSVSVELTASGLPLGITAHADSVELNPGEEKTVTLFVLANRVFGQGDYTVKLCAEDDGVETGCTYTVFSVPGPEEKEVNVEAHPKEKTVSITVENGPKEYEGVTVNVKAPEGWMVTVEPETLDLKPFETEEISVSFAPGDNAQDGTAYIEVMAKDGTVIAKKTVPLSKSELTGYAFAGASPVWALVVILAIAVVYLLARRGKEGAELEEIKAEVTKK